MCFKPLEGAELIQQAEDQLGIKGARIGLKLPQPMVNILHVDLQETTVRQQRFAGEYSSTDQQGRSEKDFKKGFHERVRTTARKALKDDTCYGRRRHYGR